MIMRGNLQYLGVLPASFERGGLVYTFHIFVAGELGFSKAFTLPVMSPREKPTENGV